MAVLLDNSKLKGIPRRWITGILVCSFFILLIALTTRWRYSSREIKFPIPIPTQELVKQVQIEDFVKPQDVTVVALVFFGRKNRVELLRCYIEASLLLSL